MNTQRQIIFHGNYFTNFYLEQPEKVQEKIDYVFKVIRTVQNVPKKFLDHLTGTDGLYEIRVEFESNIYRIFCCFDKGKLVVLFNGFQKKTEKAPKSEIDLALKLKDVSTPPTPSFQISSLLINCGRGSLKSLAGVDWMLSITYFNHNCGRCCFSCRCRKSCRTWLCRGRVLFAVKGEPLWSRRVARRTRRKERSLRPFG